MRTSLTLLVFVAVLVVAAGLFIWSGAFNIAATKPHYVVTRWLLATVREQSIAAHSEKIEPPPLTDSNLVQAGFRYYHAMCVMCHGAPGRDPSEIRQGLNPPPPKLDAEELQARYSDAQLYWIVKNGIRMTGMPAFGPTHTEEELWSIVAFLRRLPKVKPAEYGAMVEAAGLQDAAGPAHGHVQAHAHGSTEKKEEETR